MEITPAEIESYCFAQSHAESDLLQELVAETTARVPNSRMLSGRVEGRFLKMLVQISGAKKVLEVGMYTGYSALSMAEALPEGGELHTLEMDDEVAQVARRYFERSPHGHHIHIHMGDALETLKGMSQMFDFVFLDADKENYPAYYTEILPRLAPGGLMVVDNALWSGKVLSPTEETDMGVHRLNEMIQTDTSVENVLIPVRDGLHILRKELRS